MIQAGKENFTEHEILLDGVRNCRELGGIPLAGGREVKSGKLYRSGRLYAMTADDARRLQNDCRISAVIDLRNTQERNEFPNRRLAGSCYYPIALFQKPLTGISREDGEEPLDRMKRLANTLKNGGAHRLLSDMYPAMVTDPYAVSGFAEFFKVLLSEKTDAVLWHCTSGKDRTGLAAAMLLRILGADKAAVMDDYLHTNIQMRPQRRKTCELLLAAGTDEEAVRQYEELESVSEEYLEKSFSRIDSQYGSFDRFAVEKLNLTENNRTALIEKYTAVRTSCAKLPDI